MRGRCGEGRFVIKTCVGIVFGIIVIFRSSVLGPNVFVPEPILFLGVPHVVFVAFIYRDWQIVNHSSVFARVENHLARIGLFDDNVINIRNRIAKDVFHGEVVIRSRSNHHHCGIGCRRGSLGNAETLPLPPAVGVYLQFNTVRGVCCYGSVDALVGKFECSGQGLVG